MEILAFYAIAIESIEIYKCSAPQNDRQDLSFLKDFHVVGKKMKKMVKKWSFMSHQFSGFFLQKLKKVETEKIVFYDVTCDPIEI